MRYTFRLEDGKCYIYEGEKRHVTPRWIEVWTDTPEMANRVKSQLKRNDIYGRYHAEQKY